MHAFDGHEDAELLEVSRAVGLLKAFHHQSSQMTLADASDLATVREHTWTQRSVWPESLGAGNGACHGKEMSNDGGVFEVS